MALTAPPSPAPRCSQALFEHVLQQWGGTDDLWLFAYASLIWRPEGQPVETRPARVHGYHRALRMWSHINRGTPDNPGLVFALLTGGSCTGVVQRIAAHQALDTLHLLWAREMPTPVYDPCWLPARTPQGTVRALAFTLSKHSPSHTGHLSASEYQRIFSQSVGRYGSTLDYAQQTHEHLTQLGIHDHALARLLAHAHPPGSNSTHTNTPASAPPTMPAPTIHTGPNDHNP